MLQILLVSLILADSFVATSVVEFPPESMTNPRSEWNTIDQFNSPRASLDLDLWNTLQERITVGILSPREPYSDNGHEIIDLSPYSLGTSSHSRVYAINGHESIYAIKYYAHCDSKEIDPMLIESYFLERLHGLGIANEIYYFSKPFEFPRMTSEIAAEVDLLRRWGRHGNMYFESENYSKLTNSQMYYCEVPPTVRYTITERVGLNMYHYGLLFPPSNIVPFFEAIEIGIQVFHLLHKLFLELSAFHGDIHISNVVFAKPGDERSPGRKDIRLIDFGLAKILDPTTLPEEDDNDAPINEIQCHGMFSRWEVRRSKKSFRDDAYRTFLLVAAMVHGYDYILDLNALCDTNSKFPTEERLSLSLDDSSGAPKWLSDSDDVVEIKTEDFVPRVGATDDLDEPSERSEIDYENNYDYDYHVFEYSPVDHSNMAKQTTPRMSLQEQFLHAKENTNLFDVTITGVSTFSQKEYSVASVLREGTWYHGEPVSLSAESARIISALLSAIANEFIHPLKQNSVPEYAKIIELMEEIMIIKDAALVSV